MYLPKKENLKNLLNNPAALGAGAALSIAAAAVLTFAGAAVYGAIARYGEPERQMPPADFPRLAENLQAELNKSFYPEFAFAFDKVGNPFADKSNVSSAVTAPTAAPNQIILPAGGSPSSAQLPVPRPFGNTPPPAGFNQSAGSPPTSVNTQIIPAGNRTAPVGTAPAPSAAPFSTDSKKLLAERNRLIRQGAAVGDLSAIYSIADVRPIGIIGTGNKNKIWLYAPSTKQTFSVRQNTRFADGIIEAVTDEGVTFRYDNGTVETVRWMRNSDKEKNSPDAPFLRVVPLTGEDRR